MAQLLTSRSNYGLLVLIELAKNYGQRTIALGTVASSQNLPLSYIEQLMPNLRKACLVVAERGRRGGYRLARPPEAISVVEVLEALEGPILAISCQGKSCPIQDSCATCGFWLAAQRGFHRLLRKVTIADLLAKDRCYVLG